MKSVTISQISEIDPRKNRAFSPNLYRWFKKHPHLLGRCDRYIYQGVEFLGYIDDGFFCGSNLWRILGMGARTQVFAYCGIAESTELRPLWADYLIHGRCAIDPEHKREFIDRRFLTQGNYRSCIWCGLRQNLERYQVTEERDRWVSVHDS